MTQDNSTVHFYSGTGSQIEAVRHINPDGSIGGWVSPEFGVCNVTLGASVVVYPGVVISDGAVIDGHCVIMPAAPHEMKHSA